jgi:hypothetical protein
LKQGPPLLANGGLFFGHNDNITTNYDGIVKKPDAVLRFILRHCGIR